MFSLPFEVKKSIRIDRPTAEVFQFLENFENWPKWSPWLCQEPSCPLQVSGIPGKIRHRQEWHGQWIGSGSMEITDLADQTKINYQLEFLKPWKSRSQVGFIFQDHGQSTHVEWWMKGTLPFFLFFMRKMMQAFVGMDFERGLKMLKEYVETQRVPTETTFRGSIDVSEFYYLGRRRECALEDLDKCMKEDLSTLCDHKLSEPKFVFSTYHNFDIPKGKCEYTTGLAFTEKPQPVDGLECGHMAPHKALQVDHVGAYRFLGNAWSAAMSYQRAKKLKMRKDISMYEVYANDPDQVSEDQLLTQIFLPLKS